MSEYEGVHSFYWGKAIDPTPLQTWFSANMPAEDLIYKDGMSQQVMFVRDTITGVLARSYFEYKRLPKVISTHTSKSVKLPVYYFNSAYAKIIMRCNFHDWKVSVESKVGPMDMDLDRLCGTKEPIPTCYCEGFRTEWVFPPYSQNKEKFTVEIRDKYQLYTFLFLLRRAALRDGIFAKQEVQTKLKHLELLLTRLDAFHVEKREGKVSHARRMHGWEIGSAFEAIRDEASKVSGVLRYPKLDAAFEALWQGTKFNLQDDRSGPRKLVAAVQHELNAISE